MQNRAAGADGGTSRGFGSRGSRNIFEFKCYDAYTFGEFGDFVEIVIGSSHFLVGDLSRGRVRIRRIGVYSVAHAARGDGEHASKLAASEDSDNGARKNRLHSSSSDRTRADCS